jgi:hypothetical protein
MYQAILYSLFALALAVSARDGRHFFFTLSIALILTLYDFVGVNHFFDGVRWFLFCGFGEMAIIACCVPYRRIAALIVALLSILALCYHLAAFFIGIDTGHAYSKFYTLSIQLFQLLQGLTCLWYATTTRRAWQWMQKIGIT